MEYTSLNIHDQHLVCRMWKGWTHHVYLKLTRCGTKILGRLVVTHRHEIGRSGKRLEMALEGLPWIVFNKRVSEIDLVIVHLEQESRQTPRRDENRTQSNQSQKGRLARLQSFLCVGCFVTD